MNENKNFGRSIEWTALLHAHRDITINSEDVIDVFAKSNRRLDFVI